ncbi:hypothetical protein [Endozoicomonas sp. Mp262]|uniref:hypothetical protein n=1 Tax=Endozoicomonas sp. Mp262 TaxID=2919499 RepID=UPI0021DA680A
MDKENELAVFVLEQKEMGFNIHPQVNKSLELGYICNDLISAVLNREQSKYSLAENWVKYIPCALVILILIEPKFPIDENISLVSTLCSETAFILQLENGTHIGSESTGVDLDVTEDPSPSESRHLEKCEEPILNDQVRAQIKILNTGDENKFIVTVVSGFQKIAPSLAEKLPKGIDGFNCYKMKKTTHFIIKVAP